MATLAGTTLNMYLNPQQTAEMNSFTDAEKSFWSVFIRIIKNRHFMIIGYVKAL